jgi:hypothetical protein
MERNKKYKSGLSREKWLELALEALSIKSKSKFSLDSLIKSMPVTKGSCWPLAVGHVPEIHAW